MSTLLERAQADFGSGENARAASLRIAGVGPIAFNSVAGSYTREQGASEISFNTDEPLDGLEDLRVSLRLGYGDKMRAFYDGTLQVPANDPEPQRRSALAYGPFKLLAGQHLNEKVTYQGVNLEYALFDLFRRASMPQGAVEIRRGRSYTIQKETFTPETTIGEAIAALLEPAKFVAVDRPGFGRLVMPQPKPGAAGRYEAVYLPGDYARGAFKPVPNSAQRYARVTVFRRNEAGRDVVKATRPVENLGGAKPPPGRTYYVPEFPGTQEEADELAVEQARLLEVGMIPFSLERVPIVPSIMLYDTVRVVAEEERRRIGKCRVTYDCLIDGSLDFEVSREAHDETFNGRALQVSVERLYDPIVVRAPSPSVIPTPATRTAPGLITATDTVHTVNELSPYTVDEVSR